MFEMGCDLHDLGCAVVIPRLAKISAIGSSAWSSEARAAKGGSATKARLRLLHARARSKQRAAIGCGELCLQRGQSAPLSGNQPHLTAKLGPRLSLGPFEVKVATDCGPSSSIMSQMGIQGVDGGRVSRRVPRQAPFCRRTNRDALLERDAGPREFHRSTWGHRVLHQDGSETGQL